MKATPAPSDAELAGPAAVVRKGASRGVVAGRGPSASAASDARDDASGGGPGGSRRGPGGFLPGGRAGGDDGEREEADSVEVTDGDYSASLTRSASSGSAGDGEPREPAEEGIEVECSFAAPEWVREVDYDVDGPTELYQAVEREEWDLVELYCATRRSEASIWVRRHKEVSLILSTDAR